MGEDTIEERYDIIMKQKKVIDQKKNEVLQCSKFINQKLQHYKDIKDKKISDDTNPATWNEKRAKDPVD
jgi:hypothetical protein